VQQTQGVDTEALIAEVAKAGYTASLPRSKDATPTGDASEDQPDTELIALRQRLVGSALIHRSEVAGGAWRTARMPF
jgi:P-type Cu+ transporter